MRPFAPIVSPPGFHLLLCFLQGHEPVFIQAFLRKRLLKTSIEAFFIGFLGWLESN